MGQKIHPEGFRLGVRRKGEKVDFKSSWYSDRDFAELLGEDLKIRDHIEKKLSRAGIADIQIRKAAEQGEIAVDIHTARPGIVIGKGGSEVDALRNDLERLTGKKVQVNVREVSRPELNATLVAESIAEQLESRAAFRRTMKRALTSAMRSGAEGARIRWWSAGRHRDEPRGDNLRGESSAAHARCGHRLRLQGGQDPDGPDRGKGLDQPRGA